MTGERAGGDSVARPCRTRRRNAYASRRNTTPKQAAATAYSGPVRAAGQSNKEVATIAQEYATILPVTNASVATTGSIGTRAAA